MTQKIRIECEIGEHHFTAPELGVIQQLAWRFAEQDMRVTGDKTNIKIYLGTYYEEQFRLWVTPNGHISLIERDFDDHGGWERSSMLELTLALVIDQPRDEVISKQSAAASFHISNP